MAVAVVRLSKHKVLVQQLYCIETLARVDTFCADKTGTITSGKMEVDKIVDLQGNDAGEDLYLAFASLNAADNDKNETSNAIEDYFKNGDGAAKISAPLYKLKKNIPFSSDKKWSGALETIRFTPISTAAPISAFPLSM